MTLLLALIGIHNSHLPEVTNIVSIGVGESIKSLKEVKKNVGWCVLLVRRDGVTNPVST